MPTTTAPQGGGPSPAIDRAPVTPMHSLDRATPAAVPAPVGLRATGISATSADLSWSDPAGVDVVGYQVTVAGRTRVVDAPHFQLADLAPDQIHAVAVVTITASGASQPVTTSLRTCAAVPTTPMRRAAANPSLASNLAQLSRFGSTHAELAARAHGRPRPSSEGVAAFATSLGIDPSRLSAKGV